jgi:hypothetical protein
MTLQDLLEIVRFDFVEFYLSVRNFSMVDENYDLSAVRDTFF